MWFINFYVEFRLLNTQTTGKPCDLFDCSYFLINA